MFTIPKIREISKHLQYPHYWGYGGLCFVCNISVYDETLLSHGCSLNAISC